MTVIRLSHTQARGVMLRVPELHAAAMREHRRAVNRTHHDYDLPAVAWKSVLVRMKDECYGPLGGKLDKLPESVYRAISKIQAAVSTIEHHWAFEARGMIGWQPQVIPCFERTEGPRGWSPYPTGGEFLLLWPQQRWFIDHGYTIWRAEPFAHPRREWNPDLAWSWTYQREAHEMFAEARA